MAWVFLGIRIRLFRNMCNHQCCSLASTIRFRRPGRANTQRYGLPSVHTNQGSTAPTKIRTPPGNTARQLQGIWQNAGCPNDVTLGSPESELLHYPDVGIPWPIDHSAPSPHPHPHAHRLGLGLVFWDANATCRIRIFTCQAPKRFT